jgi:hypothetical protein
MRVVSGSSRPATSISAICSARSSAGCGCRTRRNVLFFLADLHALTVDIDPEQLRSSVREMAAALFASGIDPAKAVVFSHSAVPAHASSPGSWAAPRGWAGSTG